MSCVHSLNIYIDLYKAVYIDICQSYLCNFHKILIENLVKIAQVLYQYFI